MGKIVSRPTTIVRQIPHTGGRRTGQTHQLAIIMPPLKMEGYVPVGPSTDWKRKPRGTKLLPTVEILNANPGVWYKVALGKSSTVDQVKTRLLSLDNTLKFDKREESGEDQWGLYSCAPDTY